MTEITGSFGDRLFFTLIGAPTADIGTGSDIWAIDVADTYPAAEVVGADLSLLQPHYVPTNPQFDIEDADEDRTLKPKFCLVHPEGIERHLTQRLVPFLSVSIQSPETWRLGRITRNGLPQSFRW